MKLKEDIRPITELKSHTRQIREQIKRTRRPVVITMNGRADLVLLSAETFDESSRRHLIDVLDRASADPKERPIEEAIEEARQRVQKISRRRHKSR
jgi:prevent-host-death family protein